jgi:RNA polymerase sigma factor (sigma-70 family)
MNRPMTAHAEPDLGQLNRTYRPALMAFFLRRLHNHAEAEDMTQDVFVRLAKADRSQMRSAEAYIFQIAANLLRDRARREKYRADYRGDLMADEGVGVDPIDPSRIVGGQQALTVLAASLADLPELTRRIFICHRLESISRRDIASTFRLSEAAVDRHLAKALAFLIARVRNS